MNACVQMLIARGLFCHLEITLLLSVFQGAHLSGATSFICLQTVIMSLFMLSSGRLTWAMEMEVAHIFLCPGKQPTTL